MVRGPWSVVSGNLKSGLWYFVFGVSASVAAGFVDPANRAGYLKYKVLNKNHPRQRAFIMHYALSTMHFPPRRPPRRSSAKRVSRFIPAVSREGWTSLVFDSLQLLHERDGGFPFRSFARRSEARIVWVDRFPAQQSWRRFNPSEDHTNREPKCTRKKSEVRNQKSVIDFPEVAIPWCCNACNLYKTLIFIQEPNGHLERISKIVMTLFKYHRSSDISPRAYFKSSSIARLGLIFAGGWSG